MGFFCIVVSVLIAFVRSRSELVLENLVPPENLIRAIRHDILDFLYEHPASPIVIPHLETCHAAAADACVCRGRVASIDGCFAQGDQCLPQLHSRP